MINTLYLLIADMAKHLAIQIFLMMTKKMFADLIRKNYQNIHERNYYSFVQSIIAFLEYWCIEKYNAKQMLVHNFWSHFNSIIYWKARLKFIGMGERGCVCSDLECVYS